MIKMFRLAEEDNGGYKGGNDFGDDVGYRVNDSGEGVVGAEITITYGDFLEDDLEKSEGYGEKRRRSRSRSSRVQKSIVIS